MHTHAARRTGTVRRSHPRHSRHISANPLPVSRAHTPQGPCAAPAVDTIAPHTHGTDTISHAWYGDDAPRRLVVQGLRPLRHILHVGRRLLAKRAPKLVHRRLHLPPPREADIGRGHVGGYHRPHRISIRSSHRPPGERGRGPARPECCTVQGPQENGRRGSEHVSDGRCRIECGGGAAL